MVRESRELVKRDVTTLFKLLLLVSLIYYIYIIEYLFIIVSEDMILLSILLYSSNVDNVFFPYLLISKFLYIFIKTLLF